MNHAVNKFAVEECPPRNLTPIFNAEATEIVFDLRVFALSGSFQELVNLGTSVSAS
jgi:hypothetical protein